MKLNEVADKKGKIYVDMDGVIADFVAGVTKLLDDPYDEKLYKTDSKYRSKMWKAVTKFSKEGGKLWLDLPMMADAKKLWSYVEKYNPEILSATGRPDYEAETQKRAWIKKHIGANVKVNLVRQSKQKAEYAQSGDVLIDDQPKSIDPWKAAGGKGILHTSADQTIAELKKLGY